ncbi:unnamed protein product [Ixodes pacificus]
MKRAIQLGVRTVYKSRHLRVIATSHSFAMNYATAAETSTPQDKQHEDADTLTSILSRVKRDVVKEIPHFEHTSGRSFERVITILHQNGFHDCAIVNVITGAPRIVELSDSLSDILAYWRSLFLKEDAFFDVIASVPDLLYLKPSAVEERKAQLFTVFPQKDIFRLLAECPDAYTDDWDSIMAKINYVVHTMGISQGEVAKGDILAYSLLHIKTRHQFLLRCGKYRTPKPKERITKNPSLHKIVKTPVENFVRFAGLTMEEYEVFEKLMELEADREDEEFYDEVFT